MRLVLIHFITIRTSKHLQILKDQRQIILLRALLNPSQQRGHYTAKIYVSTCRDKFRCKLAVIYLPKIMKIPVRLSLILGIYGLVTMPIGNAVSRWREKLADNYALQSTGKNEAFASAFTRLANQNLGEIDPEKWVVFMFYSHPPLGERIEKARNWKTSSR